MVDAVDAVDTLEEGRLMLTKEPVNGLSNR